MGEWLAALQRVAAASVVATRRDAEELGLLTWALPLLEGGGASSEALAAAELLERVRAGALGAAGAASK